MEEGTLPIEQRREKFEQIFQERENSFALQEKRRREEFEKQQTALRKLFESSGKIEDTPFSCDLFSFEPIGFLSSCWKERYGCPRQGALVPSSKAFLQLRKNLNPSAALDTLEQFSHVWIIFLFHQNTNNKIHFRDSSRQGMNAKVKPPMLTGKKVGLFSCRTPHRPNPIGQTLAQLERIDADGTIHLRGVDLLHGTPILDIKPYIPKYEALPHARVPAWFDAIEQVQFGTVRMEPHAENKLKSFGNKLRIFSSPAEVLSTLKEVLQLDIRTIFRDRNGQPLKRAKVHESSLLLDTLRFFWRIVADEEETIVVYDVQFVGQRNEAPSN
eukprot:GCRY01004179.1.p1 GENE.GCRY01004179.1~~GCRY01004179.1.p1  ORF type:complete len:328 (-),score=35.86 GCRY01004179.1:142-1125(-)